MNDPFHTLLNMPWPRFTLLFFTTYITEFLVFAFIFFVSGGDRVDGIVHITVASWVPLGQRLGSPLLLSVP